MTANLARFDPQMLRDLAGAKVFARGQDYWRSGHVSLVRHGESDVRADVTGTETYRTELRLDGEDIDGDCTCPAFSDFGFCKHMVATALAANANDGKISTLRSDNRLHIREHLRHQGVDSLIDIIMSLAERDSDLLRRLELASISHEADDAVVEATLRRALDKATHTPDYIEYRQARGWAAGVEAVLEAIAGLVPAGKADIAIKLILRAFERIEEALHAIDDSSGHCSGLLNQAYDIHLTATIQARPEPLALARFLFAREADDDYGIFTNAAAQYAEALGDAGLAEYRRLALAAWSELPQLSASRKAPAFSYDHSRLADILDYFAAREGDLEMRIALRSKDLSSAWNYLQLAEFCLANGLVDKALHYAEEGLWLFEDNPDHRLVLFAADLLEKQSREQDCARVLWSAFETAPEMRFYDKLRRLEGEPARDRAIGVLEGRCANKAANRWSNPVDLLIQLFEQEQMFEAAWAAAKRYKASLPARERLARQSEGQHPRQAIPVYVERVLMLAESGGNPQYAEAAALIERIGKLQTAVEQSAFVDDIKSRFGRRRNFMKLLAGK